MIIIMVYIVVSAGSNNNNTINTIPTPTTSTRTEPTSIPALKITLVPPKNIKEVPTLPYSQGGGIDTSDPIVRESAKNIQQLQEALPYSKTLRTSNGLDIEILIPPPDLQENRWTFTANVYGIDYEVEDGSPEYVLMKTAFREGAAHIFNYVRQQGVEPEKLIFKWGGRVFIEERAEEWLQ